MKNSLSSESQILHKRALSLSKPLKPTKKDTSKIVCFNCESELYGIRIESVTDILALTKICWLPGLADYIAGVINKRGEIVSVVDFKAFLGLAPTERNKDCGLIIIKNKEMETSLLVDIVVGVIDVELEKMQPPPSVLSKEEAEFIQGEIKIDLGLLAILNIDNIFAVLKARNL